MYADLFMRKNTKLAFILLGCAAAIWSVARLGHSSGLRINHTPSLPIGFWSVSPLEAPLQRGQIVSFCPPGRPIFYEALRIGILGEGGCRNGLEPLLKPVIAVPGDQLKVSTQGLILNGKPVPNSARIALAMPVIAPGSYLLKQGEIWVASTTHPRSFDSRYFGAVPIEQIEGVARPILTWP